MNKLNKADRTQWAIGSVASAGIKTVVVAALFGASLASVQAETQFDKSRAYAGGGLGFNSVDGLRDDSATGFQFFGGYDLPLNLTHGVNVALEAGYMDSGEFGDGFLNYSVSAEGLWGNAVASLPLNDQVDLVGRFGLDIGDDDGIMFGFGGEYKVSKTLGLRAEYVIRDDIDSLQFNAVFGF